MSRWGWAAVVGVVAVGLGLLGFGLTRDPFVLPSPLVSGPAPQFRLEVMEPPELGPGARWRPSWRGAGAWWSAARASSARRQVVQQVE